MPPRAPGRDDARRRARSAARLYAVQALFQMEASGQTAEAVAAEFETHRFGLPWTRAGRRSPRAIRRSSAALSAPR